MRVHAYQLPLQLMVADATSRFCLCGPSGHHIVVGDADTHGKLSHDSVELMGGPTEDAFSPEDMRLLVEFLESETGRAVGSDGARSECDASKDATTTSLAVADSWSSPIAMSTVPGSSHSFLANLEEEDFPAAAEFPLSSELSGGCAAIETSQTEALMLEYLEYVSNSTFGEEPTTVEIRGPTSYGTDRVHDSFRLDDDHSCPWDQTGLFPVQTGLFSHQSGHVLEQERLASEITVEPLGTTNATVMDEELSLTRRRNRRGNAYSRSDVADILKVLEEDHWRVRADSLKARLPRLIEKNSLGALVSFARGIQQKIPRTERGCRTWARYTSEEDAVICAAIGIGIGERSEEAERHGNRSAAPSGPEQGSWSEPRARLRMGRIVRERGLSTVRKHADSLRVAKGLCAERYLRFGLCNEYTQREVDVLERSILGDGLTDDEFDSLLEMHTLASIEAKIRDLSKSLRH